MTHNFLESYQHQWEQTKEIAQNSNTRTLLQRTILRSCLEIAHSQQSFALAISDDYLLNDIRGLEKKIQNLRSIRSFENLTLNMLLTKEYQKNIKDVENRDFPNEFLLKLKENTFERCDRKWEKEIALDALESGWEFWSIKALLNIQNAEKWNKLLIQNLWPTGVWLYTETDLEPLTPPTPGATWAGKWLIILTPRKDNLLFLKENILNIIDLINQPVIDKIYP
ncbi:MAG: hypothetical protein HY072_09750 [Deltaproteobacteria bacterium]|nr:hypothetical protein [Deltaproteobacteria bacterium]